MAERELNGARSSCGDQGGDPQLFHCKSPYHMTKHLVAVVWPFKIYYTTYILLLQTSAMRLMGLSYLITFLAFYRLKHGN